MHSDIRPGQHKAVIGSYAQALQARREGWNLRDAFLVLLPGPRVVLVHLFRRPLEGTIAQTVVKYGTGGLDVDGCRVKTSGPNPSIARRESSVRSGVMPIKGNKAADSEARGKIERRGSPEAFIAEHPGEKLGRWPTNLLLVHGPGCRQDGTVQVKGTVRQPTGKAIYSTEGGAVLWNANNVRDTTVRGFGDETVATWDCEDGCPVGVLDGLSGTLTSGSRAAGVRKGMGYPGAKGDGGPPSEAGSGTASRFYPQFENIDQAKAWLSRLAGDASTV